MDKHVAIEKSIKELEGCLKEHKELSVNTDFELVRQQLLKQHSDLKIQFLSERDTWLEEKVVLTRENGALRTQIEELKFKHSEALQEERLKFQHERDRLQADLWKAKTEVLNLKSRGVVSTEPEPVVKPMRSQYTAGSDPELSSRIHGQEYTSTEIPFQLEESFHNSRPLPTAVDNPVIPRNQNSNKPSSITFAADSCMNYLDLNRVEKGIRNSSVKTYTAQELSKISIQNDPDVKPVLVTNVGINNIRRGENPEAIVDTIQSNFRRIQFENPATRIIYVSPICRTSNVCSPDTKRLNEIMKMYCRENFITFVEQIDVLAENEMWDDFHPNRNRGLDLYMNAILARIPDMPRRRGAPFTPPHAQSAAMSHPPMTPPHPSRGRNEKRFYNSHPRSSSMKRREHSAGRPFRY